MNHIYPKAGMILVPKPEKAHLFSQSGQRYIVKLSDELAHGELGEYWMIKEQVN